MNGLSPQATFKPSPNPRYPNVSGRGRGGHRRNLSHASSTGSVGDQQSPATMPVSSQGTNNSQSSMPSNSNSSSSNNNASGVKSAAPSNGPASLPVPVKGNGPNGSGSSSAPAATPPAADPASAVANVAVVKGRDRDGVVHSTSQSGNQPQTQQLPAKGQQQHPAAEGHASTGGYPSNIEERRHDRDSAISDRDKGISKLLCSSKCFEKKLPSLVTVKL